MTWRNTHARYGSLSIALHWSMLVLLAATYACIELRGQFARGSGARVLIVQFHFMLGLSVGLLVWLRLLARSLGVTPSIVPPLPAWQTRVASLMHLALYALMIGLPLLGWLILSAQNRPVSFWGIEVSDTTRRALVSYATKVMGAAVADEDRQRKFPPMTLNALRHLVAASPEMQTS